jgi:hypothetical protein
MRFENRKGQNEKKKKKKTHFAIQKRIFLLLFFGWSFDFAFQK